MKHMKQYFSQRSGKLSVFLGFLAMAGWLGVAVIAKESNSPPKISVSDHPIDRSVRTGNSFSPVVKKVAPSVVNIYSKRTLKMPRFRNPFFEFFGEDSDPRGDRPQTRTSQSLGSGAIVTEDGYILTNNHDVEGASNVKVHYGADENGNGGHTVDAKIIGRDAATDIALL